MDYNLPTDLKYTKSDEWVRLDGDIATIGITDYAQDMLNDIVYFELPEVGESYGPERQFRHGRIGESGIGFVRTSTGHCIGRQRDARGRARNRQCRSL